ncbi:DUF2752 domain-containing protein [Calidifontibacter sp. DB0510]|uniref:DUF2752 domain-containing protein n=1 Tax=Metallococcus carri TaxID=1656884 RepID=A0A967AZZ8_9MICO|nr:DUF2752 domain-containing protein [Metallococcus carri]NHN55537.1 DUF2752 domain-containing protein [Metallococcus carri]NOP38279.1 DUF2752 domain-containing protein [Calidifontibacter sp. DB2511S]
MALAASRRPVTRRGLLLPIAGIGAALLAAAVVPVSTMSSGPTTCPMLLLTGLPCPLCGATRSWTMLLHGNAADAMRLNPTAPLVMLLAIVVEVFLVRQFVTGARLPRWVSRGLFPAVVAVVAVYGITRAVLVGTGAWVWPG